jgi:phospholipid/cholesterol/gamma-HCH transport system substrate-binding protein
VLGFPKLSFILTLVFIALGIAAGVFTIRKILKVGEFKGYTIRLVSSSAEGLGVGSPVVLSGVQIGKISKIDLSEDGKNAIITLQIKGGVKIRKDAKFQLKMKGVLGDRFVSIEQGESQEILKDGDVIILEKSESEISQIASDIGQALFEFSETMKSIRKLAENLNSIVSDVNQSRSIQKTAESLSKISSETEELIRDIRRLIMEINETFNKIQPKVLESVNKSSDDIKEITKNAREISERLLRSSENIQKLLASVEKEGIISLMGEDKEKIKNIIDDINSVSPKIKDLASRAEKVVQKTENVLGEAEKNFSSLKFEIGGKFEGGVRNKEFLASQSIFAKLKRGNLFFEFGPVSPPGESTIRFNSVFGVSFPELFSSLGAGFIRSFPAFYLEVEPPFSLIRGEIIGYQFPNIRTILGGRIKPFTLFVGAENILYSNKRFFFFGLEIRK